MILKFFGATGEVTGSNFLLERTDAKTGEKVQVLVDCGLHQGDKYSDERNYKAFPFNPKDIKAVFVTHAHIDHTGRLPKLYRNGFRGKIYGTAPTRDFAQVLLLDSEDILRKEAERDGLQPFYDATDVEGIISLWETVPYDKEFEVAGFKATLVNAGHILGSACVILEADGRSVIFSGDLGNTTPTLINHFDEVNRPIDYCVIESTYGSRIHETVTDSKELLENTIEDTVHAGGTLMIPAFAMERTQRLLYELDHLTENGRIPKVPVFMDSPLAIKLTDIYNKYHNFFRKDAEEVAKRGNKLLDFPGLRLTRTSDESKAIKDFRPPKVIIAGSGMSNGGRILHHEKNYLSDPKSTILFIGYQASGTMGRRIYEGEKLVKIYGEEVSVRCKVEAIGGYSAHADQDGLLEWLRPMRESLRRVFIVHGEPRESTGLAVQIRDHMAIDAVIPSLNDEIILE